METASLVRLAHGLAKSVTLTVLLIYVISCSEDNNRPLYDVSKYSVLTKGGITFVDGKEAEGILCVIHAGDTLSITEYKQGKQDGLEKHFYEKGRIKAIRKYIKGWKQGEHEGWFQDGKKQFVYHFKDDKFEGNQREWIENGQLYSDLNFVDGQPEGTQRVWYTNGKIKTNYIIKDGRRYGLLGTKNCINTTDSVTVL
jgi:antitoxin component YwqK of YwqJK toxin-antitoxin module